MYRGIVRCDMKPEGQNTDQQVKEGQNNSNGGAQNNETVEESEAVKRFKEFLEAFKDGKLYIYNDVTVTEKDLKNTYDEFCANSREKKGEKYKDRKFDEVIGNLKKRDTDVEIMKQIINLAIWLWALPNSRKSSWIPKGQSNTSLQPDDNLLKIPGVAGGGSGYVQYKTNGIRYILYLLKELYPKINENNKKKKIDGLIKFRVSIQKQDQDFYDSSKYPLPDGVRNLLLHLYKPKKYQPIASTADKEKIVKAFWELIKNEPINQGIIDNVSTALNNLDDSLKKIKDKLEPIITQSGSSIGTDNGNFFYSYSLPLIWKGEGIDNLSLVQKLEYKKAMILYGPPGTGKTYSAWELAKEIIIRHEIVKINKPKKGGNQNLASGLIALLGKLSDFKKNYGNRISYLQFHINYSYEDFIAGQTIKNNSVETKLGFIFDVIKNAGKTKPYIVILDEINRTDISRVFGELFTAIEKRGTTVTLMLPDPDKPGKKLTLNIPDNIYFIGTMNEIDFFLERVDFALRRRFVWEMMGYDEDTLETIILSRLKELEITVDAEIEGFVGSYCEACTSLNEKVADRMGVAYHIGHAFFAEIANIYKELGGDSGETRWKNAKKILWQISIKPTLEAYCGSMDKTEKEKYLKEPGGDFYKAYFGL